MAGEKHWRRLKSLLHEQPLGVLATSARSGPHAALVAFAVSRDLREILFATSRATRKFESLREQPGVALLIDDRSNEVGDFRDAAAVTVHGRAEEVSLSRQEKARSLYLARHPYLSEFVRAPSCALLGIAVESYDLVVNFQDVHILRPGDGLHPTD